MSKTIWKFPLEIYEYQEIRMPIGAQILCMQSQDETPCIWALVDSKAEKETRVFRIFGTGHSIGDTAHHVYIGTGQSLLTVFVYHVFEIVNHA